MNTISFKLKLNFLENILTEQEIGDSIGPDTYELTLS